MVRQSVLQIRCWADVIWVVKWSDHEGVVLPCSYYDQENSITRNTQLLYMLFWSCWLSRSGISKICPQHDSHNISLELY